MIIVWFGHVAIPQFWKITFSPLGGVNDIVKEEAVVVGKTLTTIKEPILTQKKKGVGVISRETTIERNRTERCVTYQYLDLEKIMMKKTFY